MKGGGRDIDARGSRLHLGTSLRHLSSSLHSTCACVGMHAYTHVSLRRIIHYCSHVTRKTYHPRMQRIFFSNGVKEFGELDQILRYILSIVLIFHFTKI